MPPTREVAPTGITTIESDGTRIGATIFNTTTGTQELGPSNYGNCRPTRPPIWRSQRSPAPPPKGVAMQPRHNAAKPWAAPNTTAMFGSRHRSGPLDTVSTPDRAARRKKDEPRLWQQCRMQTLEDRCATAADPPREAPNEPKDAGSGLAGSGSGHDPPVGVGRRRQDLP